MNNETLAAGGEQLGAYAGDEPRGRVPGAAPGPPADAALSAAERLRRERLLIKDNADMRFLLQFEDRWAVSSFEQRVELLRGAAEFRRLPSGRKLLALRKAKGWGQARLAYEMRQIEGDHGTSASQDNAENMVVRWEGLTKGMSKDTRALLTVTFRIRHEDWGLPVDPFLVL